MKKLLLILLVSTIFLGCSKDDDNPFIGKWLVSSTEGDYVFGQGYEFYEKGKCIAFGEQIGKDDIRVECTYTIEDNILIINGDGSAEYTFLIIDKNRIRLERVQGGSIFNLLRYEEWKKLYSNIQLD